MEVPTLESGRCGRRRRLRMQRPPTTHSICVLKVGEKHHGTQGRRHRNLIFYSICDFQAATVGLKAGAALTA
jgi:hypothetical protein